MQVPAHRVPSRAVVLVSLLALLFVVPAIFGQGKAQKPVSKKELARAQYEQAEQQRTALQGKPIAKRSEAEYRRLINTYRRVYHITPHAVEVPPALLTVAEMYQEMGRQFDARYFQSSIDSYQFLLHEYPSSKLRDNALFTIAQIQFQDLNQPEVAELTFQEFLRRYPRSEKADPAREALRQIAAARVAAAAPAPPGGSQQARARQTRDDSSNQKKSPQVTGIRHWNTESSTRIVIDVEDTIEFQSERISDPDRIYFDLHRAKLSSTLAGKSLEIPNGFLKAIRVAQNQAGVVRVVFEVDKVKNYTAFLLPNPYRLVVDVYGETPQVAKKGEDAKSERTAARPTKTEVARAEPPATLPAIKEPPPPEAAVAAKLPTVKPTARPGEPAPHATRDGSTTLTRTLGIKVNRIVIDAGHGGHDYGTIGPTGLAEKDLTLDIALRLGKIIKEKLPGADVVYTRTDDTFVPLEQRTAIANQEKADLFISIHGNSSRDIRARGVETYYLNFATSDEALEVAARENAQSQSSVHELQDLVTKITNNEKVQESRELAGEIQEALANRLQRVNQSVKNRGVKKAPFVVLIGAKMPSVLTEISFLSHAGDEKLLKTATHRQRVAEGLYQGVQSYLQSLNSLSYNRQPGAVSSR